MRNANVIATDTFKAGQRAYITHRGMKHKTNVVTNPNGKRIKGLEFSAQWENAGNTPAVGVLMLFGAVAEYEITEAQFVGKGTGFPSPTAVASIGPKTPMESGTTHQPETFATDDLDVPRLFWGWILYRDIFPKSKIHVTEFCWKTTKILPDGRGGYDFGATVCDHHNCVDEFCEDYAAIATLSPAN